MGDYAALLAHTLLCQYFTDGYIFIIILSLDVHEAAPQCEKTDGAPSLVSYIYFSKAYRRTGQGASITDIHNFL